MSNLTINTDGGSRGNPGPAGIGVVIKNDSQEIIYQLGRTIGKATNNVAEYSAVISALEWLTQNKEKIKNTQNCNFFVDSALVANQLNGLWKVKDSNLRTLIIKIRQLEGELSLATSYTAIPREKNAEPDTLLNQALDNASK